MFLSKFLNLLKTENSLGGEATIFKRSCHIFFQGTRRFFWAIFSLEIVQTLAFFLGNWAKGLSNFVLSASYLPKRDFSTIFQWHNPKHYNILSHCALLFGIVTSSLEFNSWDRKDWAITRIYGKTLYLRFFFLFQQFQLVLGFSICILRVQVNFSSESVFWEIFIFFPFWTKNFSYWVFYLHSTSPGEQFPQKRFWRFPEIFINFWILIKTYFGWFCESFSLEVQWNKFSEKTTKFQRKMWIFLFADTRI